MKNEKKQTAGTLTIRIFLSFCIILFTLAVKFVNIPNSDKLKSSLYYCIKSDFDLAETINSIFLSIK